MRSLAILVFLLACFNAVIAQTSTQYDAFVQTGKSQLQTGNSDQALATGEAAIKLNPDRWEAYALAGGALMNLKHFEDAADRLSKAIDLAPEEKKITLRHLRKQCVLAEAGALAPVPVPAVVSQSSAPQVATAATQAEIVLWKTIEHSTNPNDFRTYLQTYPNGAFVPLAERQLATRDKQVEGQMAQTAESSKNPVDIQRYLDMYPNGEHAATFRARLPVIQLHTSVVELLNNHPLITAADAQNSDCKIFIKQEHSDAEDLHSAKNPLIWVPGVQMVFVYAPGAHLVGFDSYTIDFSNLTSEQIEVKHERIPNKKKELYADSVQIDLPSKHTILVQLGVGSPHTKDTAKAIMNLTPDSCEITGEKVDKCITTDVQPYHVSIPFSNEQDAQRYAAPLKQLAAMCRGGKEKWAGVANPDNKELIPGPDSTTTSFPINTALPTQSALADASEKSPAKDHDATFNSGGMPSEAAEPKTFSTATPSAVLHIARNSSTAGSLTPYIFVDQQRIIEILNHQNVKILLPPGKHTISVGGNDVSESNVLDIVAEAGKEYWIKLTISGGLWKPHSKLSIESTQAAEAESAKLVEINYGDAFKH